MRDDSHDLSLKHLSDVLTLLLTSLATPLLCVAVEQCKTDDHVCVFQV